MDGWIYEYMDVYNIIIYHILYWKYLIGLIYGYISGVSCISGEWSISAILSISWVSHIWIFEYKYLYIVYPVFRGSNVSEGSCVCTYAYIGLWKSKYMYRGSMIQPWRSRWCLWVWRTCPPRPVTWRRCPSIPLPDLTWSRLVPFLKLFWLWLEVDTGWSNLVLLGRRSHTENTIMSKRIELWINKTG